MYPLKMARVLKFRIQKEEELNSLSSEIQANLSTCVNEQHCVSHMQNADFLMTRLIKTNDSALKTNNSFQHLLTCHAILPFQFFSWNFDMFNI